MDEKKLELLKKLVDDLAFDYQRMSTSGQETYDEIIDLLN